MVITVKQYDFHTDAKPFKVPKRLIWSAWKQVAVNNGAPGVDKKSIKKFQKDLGGKRYNLWNRKSSGSYHPMPVRQVLIPKGDGFRPLGIPTVADRTTQMAAKMILEPRLERIFYSGFGIITEYNVLLKCRTSLSEPVKACSLISRKRAAAGIFSGTAKFNRSTMYSLNGGSLPGFLTGANILRLFCTSKVLPNCIARHVKRFRYPPD